MKVQTNNYVTVKGNESYNRGVRKTFSYEVLEDGKVDASFVHFGRFQATFHSIRDFFSYLATNMQKDERLEVWHTINGKLSSELRDDEVTSNA